MSVEDNKRRANGPSGVGASVAGSMQPEEDTGGKASGFSAPGMLQYGPEEMRTAVVGGEDPTWVLR